MIPAYNALACGVTRLITPLRLKMFPEAKTGEIWPRPASHMLPGGAQLWDNLSVKYVRNVPVGAFLGKSGTLWRYVGQLNIVLLDHYSYDISYTVQCHYHMVNFIQNIHNRQPITQGVMGCHNSSGELWGAYRHVAQIPQCTIPISHNAPFCNRNVHVCTFLLQNSALWYIYLMHCGICKICILWVFQGVSSS